MKKLLLVLSLLLSSAACSLETHVVYDGADQVVTATTPMMIEGRVDVPKYPCVMIVEADGTKYVFQSPLGCVLVTRRPIQMAPPSGAAP